MPQVHETYFEQKAGCGATISPFGGQMWLNWFDFNESTPKTDSAKSRPMHETENAEQKFVHIWFFEIKILKLTWHRSEYCLHVGWFGSGASKLMNTKLAIDLFH